MKMKKFELECQRQKSTPKKEKIQKQEKIEKEKEIQKMRYYYKCAQIVTVILPDIANEICKDFNYFSRNIKNYKDIFKISIKKIIKILESEKVEGSDETKKKFKNLKKSNRNLGT